MFERFHEFMETALLQKRICKVKKRIRWNNYSFPLSTQCQVKAFFSRSAWEIVFESKLANIPDIEVYQTKSVFYVELYSMEACESFFEYSGFSGGSNFHMDTGVSIHAAPKVYIENAHRVGCQIGYVEKLFDKLAYVHTESYGGINLEVPSELNRPFPASQKKIIAEIVPVRVKFSMLTNQLAVIFNKVTFNEDGVVVLALSS